MPHPPAHHYAHAFALCVLALLSTGCDRHQLPTHFEGHLIRASSTQLASPDPVGIDIQMTGSHSLRLTAEGNTNEPPLILEASHKGAQELELWSSEPSLGTRRLIAEPAEPGCYLGQDDQIAIRFCYTPQRLFLEASQQNGIPLLALSGLPFSSSHRLILESPRAYTVAEACDRALAQSFESLLEFEHLFQSTLTARAAYLNLIPHLSVNAIASNLPPSLSGLASSIGDLAPFLLPTRWIQARRSALEAKIQEQALSIMRADLRLQIESLSYGWIRDRSLLSLYESTLQEMMRIQSIVHEFKARTPEANDEEEEEQELSAFISNLKLDINTMNSILKADQMALSQGLGYLNPHTVTAIILDSDPSPIDQAKTVEFNSLTERTLARSYELQQMNTLLEVGRSQKKELLFNWIDPYGDYRSQLGVQLGTQLRVAQSRLHEIEIRRQQLRAGILKKLSEAALEYNQSLDAYAIATEALKLQEGRVAKTLKKIERGERDLDELDVADVFQEYLTSAARIPTLLAAHRSARAKLNRLLLQPPYQTKINAGF